MKKLTILAALLTMLLTASAPLVLAQQTPTPPPAPAPTSVPPPAPAPAPGPVPAPTGFIVGCQVLFNDPAATCPVDANGNITLPDGTTAPVVVEPDGTAYIVNDDETLTVIGQGESLMEDEGPPPGGPQYDNAQGGSLVPQPPPISPPVPGTTSSP
jgi:hypothetical protein